jgi:chemotaxis protein CheD
MNEVEIRVGIADYKTAYTPSKIITIGLGSCVGIAFYDPINKIGGLAHIMLPDSRQFNNVANPVKFADLAIPLLIDKMESLGANKRLFVAKIAGGASMFNFSDKSLIMDIGNRNVKSVKEVLGKLSISIKGEDTGGSQGRTMMLHVDSGKTYIKTVNLGIKEI